MASATLSIAIDRALAAYAELTELGEDIEDEWSYVNDLAEAWRDRLQAASAGDTGATIDPVNDAAIDRAIDEIARISDPHRAIDWLSTFPQVVLLAIGEEP